MSTSRAWAGGMLQELRPFQRAAIERLRDPGHLICVSSTGSGKSLIYEQIAAQEGARVLLVTPLVALARQQAARIRAAGVQAALGIGGVGELPDRRTAAWIVSPESLQLRKSVLRGWMPTHLVVDECHCLWDWGDGFRPSFSSIPGAISDYSIERSLWLTATLPLEARNELRASLPQPVFEQGGFALPPDLELRVLRAPWPVRSAALLSIVRGLDGAGLIFVNSRQATERLSRLLDAAGIEVRAYHAGLSREERRAIELEVTEGLVRVVICTSAFGMGMDFRHLRWTVLWQAPPSLLALAQSIGRVGRQGQGGGKAWVFWDPEDFRLLEWMVSGSIKRTSELAQVRRYLGRPSCRRWGLVEAFDGVRGVRAFPCAKCDFCLQGVSSGRILWDNPS